MEYWSIVESSVAENIVESDTVGQKITVEAQECNSEDDESSEKNGSKENEKTESEESSMKKEDSICRKPKTQKVESRKTKIKQEKTSKNKTNENEFAATWKAQNPKTSKRNLNTPKKSEKIKIPRKREKKSAEVEEAYEVEVALLEYD